MSISRMRTSPAALAAAPLRAGSRGDDSPAPRRLSSARAGSSAPGGRGPARGGPSAATSSAWLAVVGINQPAAPRRLPERARTPGARQPGGCYNGCHPAGRSSPRPGRARSRGRGGSIRGPERDSAMRWMARGLLLLAFVTGLACAPGASSGASGAARPSAPERPTGAAPAAPAAGASAAPAAAPASAPAEWDQVLAAARQEGTVVVDGPGGDIIRRKMVDGFTSAYPGITIEWSGGTAPELAAKLEAERRAGIYALDVMIAGTNVMLTQVKNPGFLEPIKPALLLPEVADPANWQDGRLDMADAEGEYDL